VIVDTQPDNGVVLIDTKYAGWGQEILDKVKTVTDKPVTTIINSHTHGDHTGSNTFFPATVEFIAQENTRNNKDVDTVITGHSTVMTWKDLQEFADFQHQFLMTAQDGMKAGKKVDETAAEIARTFAAKYNADTGKFKRMWGAYGNKPLDPEDRPQPSAPRAIPWVVVSEVLQQFASPVHDVKISNDGLVYVADRGNKRVQVFTPEGKFIAEQLVGLDSKYGLQARGITFSPDQRFMYVGGTPVVYILNRRTLEVLGSFNVGAGDQAHPPGHQLGSDNKGNVYVVQAEVTGADGRSGGTGAYKWVFKGYSPATKCCSGPGVHATN
jgi:DNA-binding beta-propeller fold protein YncE